MVALVEALTGIVVTVNVALVAPAATVTLTGTVAAAVLLLDSVTTAPPPGAAPVSATVPCVVFPPVRLVLASVTEDMVGGGDPGDTVSETVSVVPPYVPEMVTAVEVLTAFVFTVNVALVAPAATDTLAGTVATVVLLLESWTTAPPAGAALVRVAVPCEVP